MKFSVFFIIVLLIISCVKNNPDPAWLEVNEWSLIKNTESNEGTGELTHNFTEATVYVDNQLIGIFEVPFKIPIIKNGPSNIKVFPTIKNNGISATKKAYPFTDFYEEDVVLEANKIVTINPITKYKTNCKFWIEDFEDASIKIENDQNSKTTISGSNDPAHLMYGNFFGKVSLTSENPEWLGFTSGQISLPRGKEVYLEIDYKNTSSLTTGLFGITATQTKSNVNVSLNAQPISDLKWKKIYIDLQEVVSYFNDAIYYAVSFRAILEAGMDNGEVYIDNVKLVYIQ